jgi:hypothetical protein
MTMKLLKRLINFIHPKEDNSTTLKLLGSSINITFAMKNSSLDKGDWVDINGPLFRGERLCIKVVSDVYIDEHGKKFMDIVERGRSDLTAPASYIPPYSSNLLPEL